MSRLELFTPSKDQLMVESLYKNLEQRIVASPPGICPVDITRAFIEMCHAQTCGKCSLPCGTSSVETYDHQCVKWRC